VSGLQIDPAFEQLCLNFQYETSPTMPPRGTSEGEPLSPSSTPFSEKGSLPTGKLFAGKTSVVRTESDKDRLTKNYPNAWKDFYPSKAGCVYKSGPAWEVREGPEEQGIRREPRTVCRPDIVPVWSATLKKIISCLDDLGVDQTCINPFAWANEGDKKPFCPLLLTVGVRPESLAYQLAVSAAEAVKMILASIDLAEVEVAFQELEVSRHAGGLPPLSLNPVADNVPEYRKAFSTCLGVPIAPLSTPFLEGTGGLYLKINDDIVLLTCAHVVRPPPVFHTNSGMQRVSNSQAKEYIVALGAGGYSRAVDGMMMQIAKYTRDISTFNTQLSLPTIPVAKRTEIRAEITKLTAARSHLDTLHSEVTKFRSTPELRIFGWALYSSPIVVDAKVDEEELGYTQDWGLVQIDPKMLNLATFEGNKLYFGTSSPFPFSSPLFLLPPFPPWFSSTTAPSSSSLTLFLLCSRRRQIHTGRLSRPYVAQRRGPC
jgi:hypothetical protein